MSQIVFNSNKPESVDAQVDNFQTTLASLNHQIISLRETLGEKDKEIEELKLLSGENQDKTLTITEALINLYKFIFPPGKA